MATAKSTHEASKTLTEHTVEFQRRALTFSFGENCDVDNIDGALAHARALQAACTGVLILLANFDYSNDPDAVRNAVGAACLASTMASAVLAEVKARGIE